MTMNDEGNYQDRVVFGIATRSHSHVENVNTHTIPMNDEGKDQDGFVSGIATRSLSLVENARQSIGKIEEQTRRKRKLELEEGRIMSFLFMKDTEGPHSKAADPNANTTIVQRITKIDAPVIQPYSLERYTEIFTGDCDLLALTDAECSYDFRREDVIGRTQRKAIYGEILPPAAHFMLQTIAQLKPGSVFCDLGHGAAHLVLQAAFTTGCESRGIELMKFRHSVAESLLEYMQNRFPMPHGGRVILRNGDITNPQHRPFLTQDVDVLWCNNFGLIMGSRSSPGEKNWSVDDHIGGLFTQLKPGAKLVTLEPIQRLPHSLATATMLRRSRGLPESNEASFYEVEKIPPPAGQNNFTFKNDAPFYVYTRLGGPASFLCHVLGCYHSVHPVAAYVIENEGSAQESLLSVASCPLHVASKRRAHHVAPTLGSCVLTTPVASTYGGRHKPRQSAPQATRLPAENVTFGGNGDNDGSDSPVVGLRTKPCVIEAIVNGKTVPSTAVVHCDSSFTRTVADGRQPAENVTFGGNGDNDGSDSPVVGLRTKPCVIEAIVNGKTVPSTAVVHCDSSFTRTVADGRQPLCKMQHDRIAMQREQMEERMKMLKADPGRYRRLDTPVSRAERAAIGQRNLATWKGCAVPHYACIRQLLHEVGIDSTGCADTIRMRFKRMIRRNSVVAISDQQWRILDVPQFEGEHCRSPRKIARAINWVYDNLYSYIHRSLDANGASTYAEITRGGVDQIIHGILTSFMPHLTEGERSAFRAIDLGAGFLTCIAHIAQVIPGEYAGIEYDETRSWQFANGYASLLARHADALCNRKIAYAHMNILDLHLYDCDLVYTFDEAFPPVLWEKIVETFVASPRCKFLIMFKAAKARTGYKDLQSQLSEAGLKEVSRLHLMKKGCKDSSNAMFLIKSSFLKRKPSNQNVHRPIRAQCDQYHLDASHMFWENCKAFWGSTALAKKAVANLQADTAKVIADTFNARKRARDEARNLMTDCGAFLMEECQKGCASCDKTFRHVPANQLRKSVSAIHGEGLFTNTPIAEGTMIKRFDGRKLKQAATKSDGYTLQLDSQTWIDPIGNHRYVNHSCEPNAKFVKWTRRNKLSVVSIVALENISEGDEITVNYGDHHDLRSGQRLCRCNAPSCVSKKTPGNRS